jgi:hypothetical protein
MNHNPHNLQIGQTVQLDAEHYNSSQVIIKSFTPNYIFAEVFSHNDSPEDSWETMTDRLTPIN